MELKPKPCTHTHTRNSELSLSLDYARTLFRLYELECIPDTVISEYTHPLKCHVSYLITILMSCIAFLFVQILSKDSVTVAVDAVVYFRINNAIASVSNVEDYARSTRLLAATTLRNVLGTKNLSEILSERESISHMIQTSLDEATESWGVKVERVEM